jgi:hypothetical protein
LHRYVKFLIHQRLQGDTGREWRTVNRGQGAEIRELSLAESRGQRVEKTEQRATSNEERAKSKEQRAESRD